MQITPKQALRPVALALLAAACGGDGSSETATAQDETPAESSTTSAEASADAGVACPEDGEEFETAKLYIEQNATDADTGVHGLSSRPTGSS